MFEMSSCAGAALRGTFLAATLTAGLAFAGPAPAIAQQPVYKIGAALGMTGYGADTDRPWAQGAELAVAAINAKGGLLGHKLEYIVEDNHSDPQQAVVVYRKMLSDNVQIFDSGCVSAGNFAGAPSVVRKEIPMVLCSILPPRPAEQHWAFSTLPPPRFEIETRYAYLKNHTDIREIGILHDPTPYAMLMDRLALKVAPEFGLKVVANETYQQDDSDMSVQVGRIHAAGGGAIVKMGQGGSLVTVAKNIKQLGLTKMLLMGSIDNGTVFHQAAAVIGDRLLFVAPGVQIPASIKTAAGKAAAEDFLRIWRTKYGDNDALSGARGWDSIMIIAKAAEIAHSLKGPAMRAALEKVHGFQGAISVYNFSPTEHNGITENPFVIGVVQGNQLVAK